MAILLPNPLPKSRRPRKQAWAAHCSLTDFVLVAIVYTSSSVYRRYGEMVIGDIRGLDP
jgi:hypothetical protein